MTDTLADLMWPGTQGVIDFLGPLVLDEELNQVSQRLGWVEVGGCG